MCCWTTGDRAGGGFQRRCGALGGIGLLHVQRLIVRCLLLRDIGHVACRPCLRPQLGDQFRLERIEVRRRRLDPRLGGGGLHVGGALRVVRDHHLREGPHLGILGALQHDLAGGALVQVACARSRDEFGRGHHLGRGGRGDDERGSEKQQGLHVGLPGGPAARTAWPARITWRARPSPGRWRSSPRRRHRGRPCPSRRTRASRPGKCAARRERLRPASPAPASRRRNAADRSAR